MIAKENGEILYLSDTYPGSMHDKKIYDYEQITLSKNINMFIDLGFIGLTSEHAKIMIPYKRKKNFDLTEEQKNYNKWVSSIRVKVEHIIGNVKIFRKAKDKYRGRLYAREDNIMVVACALHNLKLKVKENV